MLVKNIIKGNVKVLFNVKLSTIGKRLKKKNSKVKFQSLKDYN